MIRNIFWNRMENRARAGWRVMAQICLVALPLIAVGLTGFYLSGRLELRIAATAVPITLFSVVILARYVDKRSLVGLGINLRQRIWWKDYGFGLIAGVLAASSLSLGISALGWARIFPSYLARRDIWPFLSSLAILLLSYIGVGIFEEIMRAYQIQNVYEGLAGSKLRTSWAAVFGVLFGGIWSVVAHLARPDPSFLTYILLTGVIYGCFFIWTRRAALAMAMHFAWDFTNTCIFQLGSSSQPSFFYVNQGNLPDIPFNAMDLAGMISKLLGLLLVLWWINRQEGGINLKVNPWTPRISSQTEIKDPAVY